MRTLVTLFTGEKPQGIDFAVVNDYDGLPIGDITGYTVVLLAVSTAAVALYTGPDVTCAVTNGAEARIRATWAVAIPSDKAGDYTAQFKLSAPASGEIRLTEIFDISVLAPVA